MTDLLLALLRANLVAALAILAVMAARAPFRRWFGAETAYSLWLAPPIAVTAGFMPLAPAAAPRARRARGRACAPTLLRRTRRARGLYARTLLKAQLASQRPPLVSAWAAGGRHPLEVRVGALTRLSLDDGARGP